MKRIAICSFLILFCASLCRAQSVRLGNVVCNPGAHFTVPVEIDHVEGVASVYLLITYDPLLLVLTDVKAGSLADHFDTDFLMSEEPGVIELVTFGKRNGEMRSARGGSVALLSFAAREGSAGSYSDLTLSDVRINERTMTADLTVGAGLQPTNGLMRAFATTESCTERRGTGPLTVIADTELNHLTLLPGDQLQVSDKQTPVIVKGDLTVTEAIGLQKPEHGWATATYKVLKTTAKDVTFTIEGEQPDAYTVTTIEEDGMMLYSLKVSMDDEVPITLPSDVDLDASALNALRDLLADRMEGATTITVIGSTAAIEAGLDLGIVPETTLNDGMLTAMFAMPQLVIKSFEPKFGRVNVQVIPAGNASVGKAMATGVLHVFGTESLLVPMTEIENPEIDLTAYLGSERRGEVSVVVELGQKTFIKVVAGRTSLTTFEKGDDK